MLVKAEEFKRRKGRLPRPRVINAAGAMTPVDELLIPLLDEAVRRDLAVEAALKRGDIAGAAALMAGKSKRHAARDRAAQASADGDLAGEIGRATTRVYIRRSGRTSRRTKVRILVSWTRTSGTSGSDAGRTARTIPRTIRC